MPFVHDNRLDRQPEAEMTLPQFVAGLPEMPRFYYEIMQGMVEELSILGNESDLSIDDITEITGSLRGAISGAPPAIGTKLQKDLEGLSRFKAHWMPKVTETLNESAVVLKEFQGGTFDMEKMDGAQSKIKRALVVAPRSLKYELEFRQMELQEVVRSTALINPGAQPKPKTSGRMAQPSGKLGMFTSSTGKSLSGKPVEAAKSDTEQQGPTDEQLREFISLTDPKQGGLGDCYLIAALSSLAGAEPGAIYSAVQELGPSTYAVRFFKKLGANNYTPVVVQVDHKLPTGSDHAKLTETVVKEKGWRGMFSMFGQKEKIKELWVAVIEKAWAKFVQVDTGKDGYATIGGGGHANLIFEALTGRAATVKGISGQSDRKKDKLWNQIQASAAGGKAMTAGTSVPGIINQTPDGSIKELYQALKTSHNSELQQVDPQPDKTLAEGDMERLKSNIRRIYGTAGTQDPVAKKIRSVIGSANKIYGWHVYSVLSTRQAGDVRQVRMRNPWGDVIPNVATASTEEGDDQGTFWLNFDDFVKLYGNLHFSG